MSLYMLFRYFFIKYIRNGSVYHIFHYSSFKDQKANEICIVQGAQNLLASDKKCTFNQILFLSDFPGPNLTFMIYEQYTLHQVTGFK